MINSSHGIIGIVFLWVSMFRSYPVLLNDSRLDLLRNQRRNMIFFHNFHFDCVIYVHIWESKAANRYLTQRLISQSADQRPVVSLLERQPLILPHRSISNCFKLHFEMCEPLSWASNVTAAYRCLGVQEIVTHPEFYTLENSSTNTI